MEIRVKVCLLQTTYINTAVPEVQKQVGSFIVRPPFAAIQTSKAQIYHEYLQGLSSRTEHGRDQDVDSLAHGTCGQLIGDSSVLSETPDVLWKG